MWRTRRLWLAVLVVTAVCGVLNLVLTSMAENYAEHMKKEEEHPFEPLHQQNWPAFQNSKVNDITDLPAYFSDHRDNNGLSHKSLQTIGNKAEHLASLSALMEVNSEVDNSASDAGRMTQVGLSIFGPIWGFVNPKCNRTWVELGELNQTRADQLARRFQLDWTLDLPGHHTAWTLAAQWVTDTHIYPEHHPHMGVVLRTMATAKIEKVEFPDKTIVGQNFKLIMTLAGGQRVLFKPKWYPRDHVHKISSLCVLRDTHIGEIIAFHLSRILGFRKTPLAVGRILDFQKDIMDAASPNLLPWINYRGNKSCVRDLCTADGGRIEGGLMLWLPDHVSFRPSLHPWGRMCPAVKNHTFLFRNRVNTTEDICRMAKSWGFLKNKADYFLNVVDAAILQYLIQSSDRKLYVGKGNTSDFMPVLDNAKSFADPNIDFEEILSPLYHCCRVRESTYRRLQSFQNGSLSHVLREVTRGDPVSPLLTPQHLRALDRRLHAVLTHVHRCVCHHGAGNVLITD